MIMVWDAQVIKLAVDNTLLKYETRRCDVDNKYTCAWFAGWFYSLVVCN